MTAIHKQVESVILRTLMVLITALLITPDLASQQMVWKKDFDTGRDGFAQAVCADSVGNIIVTGWTYRINGTTYDWLTIKYNPDGDTIWTRRFGNGLVNYAHAVVSDSWGNIIVAGETQEQIDSGTVFCTVKYSPRGDTVWTRTFHSKGTFDCLYGIAVDSKGNVIVTGRGSYFTSSDYVTIKYDPDGNIIWKRVYDDGFDVARAITVDDSDNVIVTGYSDGNTFYWSWCTVKYTADGDTVWIARHDTTQDNRAYGISTDGNGNVIVAGSVHDASSLNPVATIMKYSRNGEIIWEKMYDSIPLFISVKTDKWGNIFTTGGRIRPGAINSDIVTMKCNSNGDTVWRTVYSDGYGNGAKAIALDSSNNIIVFGESTTGPVGSNPPEHSYYVTIKYRSTTESVDDNAATPLRNSFTLKQNYPNPFNPITSIEYTISITEPVKLQIYDIAGNVVSVLVDEEKHPGVYIVHWNAAKLASGMYVARLAAGDLTICKKLLLIK
jgi:uncharacterized delta-60 repeat protein